MSQLATTAACADALQGAGEGRAGNEGPGPEQGLAAAVENGGESSDSQANDGAPAEPVPASAAVAAAKAPAEVQVEVEPQAAAAAEQAKKEPQAAVVPKREHTSLFGRAAAAMAAVGTVR